MDRNLVSRLMRRGASPDNRHGGSTAMRDMQSEIGSSSERAVGLLPIYYINLDARPDRRDFMESQFAKLGLAAQRVSGTTPAELTPSQLERYCDPRRAYFLSPQQLCCTLSHVRAWQAMMDAGAERAVILEDDAVLSARLPAFLSQLPAMAFDIVRLENSERPHLTSELLGLDVAGIGFRTFRSTGWGSAAYIITRETARGFMASPKLYDLPTDATLFCPLEKPASDLRLALADPALCVQLVQIDGSVGAGASGIRSFLEPKSFTAWWTPHRRGLRWLAIKLLEKVTRRDLKRRIIPFADQATG
jgi:glycosyl transferase family 25